MKTPLLEGIELGVAGLTFLIGASFDVTAEGQ